jgi:hypothetical protein
VDFGNENVEKIYLLNDFFIEKVGLLGLIFHINKKIKLMF